MELKTQGELLLDVLNEDGEFYSVNDFLVYSTEDDRKRIEKKLVDVDYKQYLNYMDSFEFVNKDEVYCAVCEYREHTQKKQACMWDCVDFWESADYYIMSKWLEFDD